MEKPIVREGKFRGFVLEMREMDDESNFPWRPVDRLPANKLKYRLKELKSNTTYEFRVGGVVDGFGLSEYSKPYVIHTSSGGE